MIGRRLDSLDQLERPGDYCGPITEYSGDKPAVFFIPPGADSLPTWPHGRLHHVVSPPHVFRECPDGSVEIRESIGCRRTDGGDGFWWHGYLDEGHVWRTV